MPAHSSLAQTLQPIEPPAPLAASLTLLGSRHFRGTTRLSFARERVVTSPLRPLSYVACISRPEMTMSFTSSACKTRDVTVVTSLRASEQVSYARGPNAQYHFFKKRDACESSLANDSKG